MQPVICDSVTSEMKRIWSYKVISLTIMLIAYFVEYNAQASLPVVRLVNTRSSNLSEGRLEIYYNGAWGTVCDDYFSHFSARVACFSLGFGYNGESIGNLHGAGTGPIWLDDVICSGTERRLDECRHSNFGTNNCGHSEDVSITCNVTVGLPVVRLVNTRSSNPDEGRLELYYNGTWGTVCDDEFSHVNARVACASLGYGYIGEVIGNQHGTGTGPIWLDDVSCSGTERRLDECRHSNFGTHNCGHHEDVSITCSVPGLPVVRLVNTRSSNPAEGRLELYYNGTWGTVCDDEFSHVNARVACASLGYGYIGEFIGNQHGAGTGPIWLDDVICSGTERRLDECRHSTVGTQNCGHHEDVSITCSVPERSATPWILLSVFAVLVGLSFLTVISVTLYKSCKSNEDLSNNPQTLQLSNISTGAHHAAVNETQREGGGYKHIQLPSYSQTRGNYYESIHVPYS